MVSGQFRIVEETFFFLIGIMIVSIVVYSLTTVESDLKNISITDHFLSISEQVINGIVKVSNFDNATIRLEIPKKICERFYVISFQNGNIIVYDYEDPSVNVTQKLFGIDKKKMLSGYVFSTAGHIIIKSTSNKIVIGR